MNQEPSGVPETNSRLERIGQLRAQIVDVMPDAETLWRVETRAPRGWLGRRMMHRQPRPAEGPPAFRGQLSMDPEQAYTHLRERFAALGYTPLLRRQGDHDLVIALPHVFPRHTGAPLQPAQWVPNLVLLLATVVTTVLAGAINEQAQLMMQDPLIFFRQPSLILTGIPAALTIMGILGFHELSHYFVSRRHGLQTTLPYFIPFLPVPGGFGTFGAIIRAQTPWENRKALFDVGLAGPLAGFVVALPIFFLGLMTSPHRIPEPGAMPLGSPLLLRWIEDLVYVLRDIPQNHEIYANGMTYASWFGLFVTGVNLLPVGQFDGGHVAYALLGRWARVLGVVVLGVLVVLGTLAWQGWYVWAALIVAFGRQHPAPLNALAPLGRGRTIAGVLALVLLALLFTPAPFPI